MDTLNRYGPLAGRILIAILFVLSGISKISGFEGTVAYISSKGLPFAPIAAIGALVVELGGGLMLILGWKARWAAAAMFVFTALAALIFHNFWAVPADQVQNTMIHFLKNISIMGGLLFIVVHGSGPMSLDRSHLK
jgi:putative oxidoreductase